MDNIPQKDASSLEITKTPNNQEVLMNDLDYTPPREFCAKTALDSDAISDENGYTKEGGSFGYYVWEHNIRKLGCDLAMLIAMIEGLSTTYGYCFMKNKTFACRFGVSSRSIERWLEKLEAKKLIYRNTWNTPKCRVRHIVPSSKYIQYWREFLMRKSVGHDVRKKYLEFLFEGNPPDDWPNPPDPKKKPPKNPPKKDDKFEGSQPHQKGHATDTSVGVHATDTCDGSLLLRINSSKHKERTTEGTSPQNVVVDSFEKKIKAELASINITGPRCEMAVQYYRKHKDLVEAKANPMGWIIQGVQKGWISDMVLKDKEKREVKPQEAMDVRTHTKMVTFLQEQLPPIANDEIAFKLDQTCVKIHFKKKNRWCPLGLRDKSTLEKLYNCLGNYKLWDELERFTTNFPPELESIFDPREREKQRKAG